MEGGKRRYPYRNCTSGDVDQIVLGLGGFRHHVHVAVSNQALPPPPHWPLGRSSSADAILRLHLSLIRGSHSVAPYRQRLRRVDSPSAAVRARSARTASGSTTSRFSSSLCYQPKSVQYFSSVLLRPRAECAHRV